MKIKNIITLLSAVCIYQAIGTRPIIRLSMRPLRNPTKLLKKIKNPGKMCQYQLETITNHNASQGIFSMYSGYLGTSNYNGETFFPLHHQDPITYIIITEKVLPISAFANTVNHWELVPEAPAAMFKCEIKKDSDNLFFWHIDKVPLPENNIIPLPSITIIAPPSKVVVPEGISVAHNNPNILLPDIYVKNGINKVNNAFYMLNLNQFLADVMLNYNKEANGYEIKIESNI